MIGVVSTSPQFAEFDERQATPSHLQQCLSRHRKVIAWLCFLCAACSEDGISDYHPASSRVMRLHCMVRPLLVGFLAIPPRGPRLDNIDGSSTVIDLIDRLMDWLIVAM